MAFIQCPECGGDVSEKAFMCPKCGYPLQESSSTKKKGTSTSKKYKKLPNGVGTVYHLSGNRRKPWRAVVTDKWVLGENGRAVQERITIGYFEKREDALTALMNYHESPYDIKAESITFEEVYQKWSEQYFPTLAGPSSIRTITAAYAYCTSLYKMRMRDIRVNHLEGVIMDAKVGDSTKGRMKSLFNMVYKFALSHEIVDKDYASLMFATGNPINRDRVKDPVPFSQAEIDALWEHYTEIPFADMVLIDIYSGWRPQELATLKADDIDLENDIMRGGLKTEAGKNRIVPIHQLIKPLIEKRMQEAQSLQSEFLFNDVNSQTGMGMTYDKWRKRFVKVMSRLKFDHHGHECRHTFITKAKACNVDEYILKLIVGHSIQDITEKVYTHRTLEQLQQEMRKITK